MEHKQALTKAKIAILAAPNSAFLADVCFSLTHSFDESTPTAATNGTYVKYSSKFFMSLSAQERVFLILHETLHVAFMHTLRKGNKNHIKYNMAADYVINAFLINAGFKMPKEGLYDKQYEGLSTEEVYALLPDTPKMPQNLLDIIECVGTEDQIKEATEAVNDILIRAAMSAKAANSKPGSIPKELEIYINKLTNPKLPWYKILNKYFSALDKSDFSFRKPNKRFIPNYLPSLYNEGLGHIAIAVDASGSVSDTDFSTFVFEIGQLIKKYKPKEISLITFDTCIKSVIKLTTNKELQNIKFIGRGGTDVLPVINWINENKPILTLVFTDGEFHKYQTKINSPVVWLIHNNPDFTYQGKTVHYEL